MVLLQAAVSNSFVVLLGMGTVFVGLICIIAICSLVGKICQKCVKEPEKTVQTPALAPAVTKIENRGEMIAAVSAAIAEELGTDVSAIRIVSFKKL